LLNTKIYGQIQGNSTTLISEAMDYKYVQLKNCSFVIVKKYCCKAWQSFKTVP